MSDFNIKDMMGGAMEAAGKSGDANQGLGDITNQIKEAMKVPRYIVDIIVIRGKGAAAPEGYEKLDVDLNMKAGGSYLYLCIKRGSDATQAITDLVVVQGKNAPAPAGFQKINVDLNEKAGGKYLYLCFKRSGSKAIEDIQVVAGDNNKVSLPGYHRLEQDLNEKAGGKYIYLFWK